MRAVLAMTVLAAVPLAGQDSFRFRYDPASGRAVNSLTEIRTLYTMNGLPRVPDGTTEELEARLFGNEVVRAVTDDGRRVRVAVDSIRLRQREGAGAWTDVTLPGELMTPTIAVVNERLHVDGIETSSTADGTQLRILTGWTGNLGFRFPDTAVAVGGTFTTGAQLPYEVSLSEDVAGIGVAETLLGELQFTLDSLVARGTDTLAYLRFSGTFAPRTVETAGEAGALNHRFDGGFAGSVLWSTGWDAFVSTAMRVRVTGRIHRESAAGVMDANVTWDATLVHRIRP